MNYVNRMENPVNLAFLRNEDAEKDYEIVLENDIWQNNLLLLKKGVNLNGLLLEKLLNFGVKEAYVNLTPLKSNNFTEIKDNELIKNQSVLIVQKNIKEVSRSEKMLLKAGFSEKNIFVSDEISGAYKYLNNKSLQYIFIDNTLYSQNFIDTVSEQLDSRYLNMFVTDVQTLSQIRKLKEVVASKENLKIRILHKPLDSSYIKALISLCSSAKFKKLVDKSDDIKQVNT